MRLLRQRPGPLSVMIGLISCAPLVGCAAVAGGAEKLPIRVVDLPSQAVLVGPGELKTTSGSVIHVAETRLTFKPPEIRDGSVHDKTPRDHADFYDPWEPWPSAPKDQPPNSIALSPRQDENGTLILGGLFRAIVPDSVVVTNADGSKTFQRDLDYKYNSTWGQVANFDGRLGKPGEGEIRVRFQYATQRLDLVQVDAAGKVTVKLGKPVLVCPALPGPDMGNTALAGIYIAPWKEEAGFAITAADIFPIEPVAPVQPVNPGALAGSRRKLAAGKELKIAFLGASVTLGAESGAWWDALWTDKNLAFPSRVVVELRRRFPKATVTPIAAFQGGIATPRAAEIFEKTVVPEKPDLLVIELGLNDAGGPIGGPPTNPPEKYKAQLLDLIKKAQAGGTEVLLVTEFQANPWLANQMAQRVPAYRQALLELAKEQNVACADVYTEWMNQAKHGVPPFSQLHNWINHPGPEGHKLMAEVLLRFFDNNQ